MHPAREKKLWQVSVTLPVAAEDAASELFSRVLAAPCAAYHDLETGRSTVGAFIHGFRDFLSAREALKAGLKRIADCGLVAKAPRLSCTKLKREDWAESWKRHFKPLEISSQLLIKPSWSRRKARKGQAVVVLDPGLSFGTGNHPTTSYCLRELARAAEGNRGPFLDAGTGSGILAIAAAKLGFTPIDAFDFDREAIAIARGNAKRNGVGKKIRFLKQHATRFRSRKKYSIICANLSADILEKTMEIWADCLAPAGILIVAGILKQEFHSIVTRSKKCGLSLVRGKNEREWSSGSMVPGPTVSFGRVRPRA